MLGYVYEEWRESAVCKSSDPELWFPEHGGDGGRKARNICRGCPVIASCAKATLKGDEKYGVWAGINVASDDAAKKKLRRLAAGEAPSVVLGEERKPKQINPDTGFTINHGTVSGYKYHKCRCDECRAAVRAQAHARAERKRGAA